jgi:hypothetical protein
MLPLIDDEHLASELFERILRLSTTVTLKRSNPEQLVAGDRLAVTVLSNEGSQEGTDEIRAH